MSGGSGPPLGRFWSSGVVPGTDLGGGNVDISVALAFFFSKGVCVFHVFIFIFMSDLFFDDSPKIIIF